jgi:integrase
MTLGLADDFDDANGDNILTFAQAQEKARAWVAPDSASREPTTVADVMAAYLVHLEKDSKSTEDARSSARAHILPALGKVKVAELTTKAISQWHKNLAETPARVRSAIGAAPQFKTGDDPEAPRRRRNTANRVLSVLKAALNLAHKGKQGPAPWRDVEPYKGVDTARVRYLSIDEARRLINASPPALRTLVRAALATGCRFGELCALNVEDYNADSQTLLIRMSKSGKSRHVALADEGVALFESLTVGRAPQAPMLERTPEARWQPSAQTWIMTVTSAHAGIEPPVNFHALRHTFASHAVMNGAPLVVVAANLGHASTEMTEKHYAHLAPQFIKDEIRRTAPKFGYEEPTNVAPLRGRSGR